MQRGPETTGVLKKSRAVFAFRLVVVIMGMKRNITNPHPAMPLPIRCFFLSTH